jgi:hypothetical protein
VYRTVKLDVAVFKEDAALTYPGHEVQVVTDDYQSLAVAGEFLNLVDALPLERFIADGKDFIDEENFRIRVHGDRECQPQIHP